MTLPDIYQIQDDTKEKSPYFFSHDTLHFFGQNMGSFRIVKSPQGKIFIYAPSYWHSQLMGYTFREYVDHDLILPREVDNHNLNSIKEYISNH